MDMGEHARKRRRKGRRSIWRMARDGVSTVWFRKRSFKCLKFGYIAPIGRIKATLYTVKCLSETDSLIQRYFSSPFCFLFKQKFYWILEIVRDGSCYLSIVQKNHLLHSLVISRVYSFIFWFWIFLIHLMVFIKECIVAVQSILSASELSRWGEIKFLLSFPSPSCRLT